MHEFYPTLLSPVKAGSRILKNRMICPPSAPGTIQGPQSYPTETLIRHYAARAKNGAAIVTCSGHYLTPPDRNGHMWGWDVRNGLTQNMMSEMAEAIHLHGSLANGFLISFPEPGYDVSAFDPEKNSEIRFMLSEPFVEMPTEMVYETIDRYVTQVRALRECGFDGVQIHMCYRFTLAARFLSPMTNVRADEFGGSLENRLRFAKLLCGGIKKACGQDFLIDVTISGHDPVEGGWSIADSIAFSKQMRGLVDIMTVRASTLDPQHPTGYEENPRPWKYMAEEIKKGEPEMLIAASSGLFDPAANEALLAAGKADLVSMARAFISNPEYGKCVQEHRPQDLVPCVRCNKCIVGGPSDPWLTVCTVNPRHGMEPFMEQVRPSGQQKKVAVIGGGPAGMMAAITAAEQGHTVHLFEKTDRLGGLLKHTDHVAFKWPMRDYKNYLIRKTMENRSIVVHLNTELSPAELERQEFEAVIAAVGSRPVKPPIPGVDAPHVHFAADVIGTDAALGARVVIVGGGEIGVETGIYLARRGHRVTVLEMTDALAREAIRGHYYSMIQAAWEAEENFSFILNATCTGITPESVRYRGADGEEHAVPADDVLLAAGMRAKTDEALQYGSAGQSFCAVGDCQKAASVQQAIRSAYTAAMAL